MARAESLIAPPMWPQSMPHRQGLWQKKLHRCWVALPLNPRQTRRPYTAWLAERVNINGAAERAWALF